jgi:hypothetical protein
MGEPLIVVSTLRVKQGRLEDVTRYYKKTLELIEANEPQLMAFHGFLSEDGTEISSVQVHPDTISMDFHMQVLKDNWDKSFSKYGELLELIRVEYFGKPSKHALNMDVQRETPMSIKPRYIAGFTHPTGT